MFAQEVGQQQLVVAERGSMAARGRIGNDIELCVEQDRERKLWLAQDRRCGMYLQRRFQLVSYLSMSNQWVLKFTGTVKIRRCDTSSRCKSREGGYRVSYGRTLRLSGRRRFNGVYIRYVKRYNVCHQYPIGRENTKF